MKCMFTLAASAVVAMALTPAFAAGDAEAGKTKAQICASCHGVDGASPNPQFPNLAGQHADYLERALQDYKSGARNNAIMKGFVSNLSTQDIEDLAAFYASQPGTLFTPTNY